MTTSSSTTTPPTVTPGAMPDSSDETLLTLAEAATILRVPVNTMRWWRQQGTGPGFFKIGRNLVTTVGDLRRWIEEQKQAVDAVRRNAS